MAKTVYLAFGTKRPEVQILSLRPKIDRFQPVDFLSIAKNCILLSQYVIIIKKANNFLKTPNLFQITRPCKRKLSKEVPKCKTSNLNHKLNFCCRLL